MFALLLISIFVLALASIAYFRFIKPSGTDDLPYGLPPPPRAGLFNDTSAPRGDEARAAEDHADREALIGGLRTRAGQGDPHVLIAAHESGGAALYDELLSALVARARTSPEELRALAYFVTRHAGLRGNAALAEAVLDDWAQNPGRASAHHALHVAALSGDATLYGRAVEAALRHWRAGELSGVVPEQLAAQVESEFWLLDARARASGAGFVLKQTIADARRELLRGPRVAADIPGGN